MSTEEKAKLFRRQLFVISLVLFAGTVGLFWPVQQFPFIGYDDPFYVANNPHVLAGLKWDGIVWAFSNITSGFTYWHPVSWMSHMLDAQVFGGDAGKHHSMSVVYHGVNVLLLFFLLRKMTGSIWRSAFVAAIFAWHPLQVESVAWVTERKNLLSTFFLLLTVWTYTRYVSRTKVLEITETPDDDLKLLSSLDHLKRQLTRFDFWLPLICFALGLMSKPMLVTVPVVLLLLDFWPLNRMATLKSLPALIAEKIPFGVLSVISALITVQAHKEFDSLSTDLSLRLRVTNALLSYVRYLKKLVWPNDLGAIYPFPTEWPVSRLLGCLLILGLLTCLAFYVARRRPYVLFGWLWFLITLLPVIGIVQAGSQAMADRFLYVPMIGLLIAVIWLLGDGLRNLKAVNVVAPSLACLVLVPSLIASRHQLYFWKDSVVLFERAIAIEPINPIAQYNLGYAYMTKDQPLEAKKHFEKTVEISSGYADARNNLAAIALSEHKPDEAIAQYQAILKSNPRHPLAHYNWGIILQQQNNFEEALPHFRSAVQNDPQNAESRNMLGNALMRAGKFDEGAEAIMTAIKLDPHLPQAQLSAGNLMLQRKQLPEAIQYFSEAVRLKPDFIDAQYSLGNALAMSGRIDQALPHFAEVVRLKPEVADGYFPLGMALQQTGNVDSAVRAFREGLRINPDFMPMLVRLGWILATYPEAKLRDGAEAVRLASRAVELTHENNAEALDLLAAAQAETGKFAEAAATAQKAVTLASAGNQSAQASQIEARLQLYKQERSYRMQ